MNEIKEILNKSKHAREFYRENPRIDLEELLSNFKAIIKIEDLAREKVILEEALNGYLELFNFNPIDIWNRIKDKTDSEIRMDFAKLKEKYNKNGGNLNLDFIDKNNFKLKINGTDNGISSRFEGDHNLTY